MKKYIYLLFFLFTIQKSFAENVEFNNSSTQEVHVHIWDSARDIISLMTDGISLGESLERQTSNNSDGVKHLKIQPGTTTKIKVDDGSLFMVTDESFLNIYENDVNCCECCSCLKNSCFSSIVKNILCCVKVISTNNNVTVGKIEKGVNGNTKLYIHSTINVTDDGGTNVLATKLTI